MREIQLTHGKAAIVDDIDYEWLNQWKWYAHKIGNVVYARRSTRKDEGLNGKQLKMHQQIIGERNGFITDHINGNGLDNRRCNLRHVTSRQNQQNRHDKTTSKYPGVYWRKDRGKWASRIKINGTKKFIGMYENEQDAFNAYCKAVEMLGDTVLLGC